MASQKEVTDWILNYSQKLDLQVTKLTWINQHFPHLIDLATSINVSGKIYSGRGSGENEEVALGKAVCEAIERFVCDHHSIRSTGVAGHFSHAAACENAQMEFEERLALSLHIEGSPLARKSLRKLNLNIGESNVQASLHCYQMRSSKNHFSVLAFIEAIESKAGFGAILGLGCGDTLRSAQEKAEVEALRNASALSIEPIFPISESEFRRIASPTANERRALLFDVKYARKLLGKLTIAKELVPLRPLEDIIFHELPLPMQALDECPLVFVRCCSQKTEIPIMDFVG